jgi:hypothetical protein
VMMRPAERVEPFEQLAPRLTPRRTLTGRAT